MDETRGTAVQPTEDEPTTATTATKPDEAVAASDEVCYPIVSVWLGDNEAKTPSLIHQGVVHFDDAGEAGFAIGIKGAGETFEMHYYPKSCRVLYIAETPEGMVPVQE